MFICIQESRLKSSQNFKMNGYETYRKDREVDGHASGGVSIHVKNSIQCHQINIQTELEVIAIQSAYPENIAICCCYIPPDIVPTMADMEAIINQLNTPYILVGDFNSHNTIWNSNYTNARGRLMENLLDEHVLLNDGSPTYFCSSTNTFSAIDLTLCTPRLATKLTWRTIPEMSFGGGHIPIIIVHELDEQYKNNTCDTNMRKWECKGANWDLFQELMSQHGNFTENIDGKQPDSLISDFTEKINEAANSAVPKKYFRKNKHVPWWNSNCEKAIRDHKKAYYKYKRNKSLENLIIFKKARAYARKVVQTSKEQSWRNYVSTITTETPMTFIWDKIRKIKGQKTPTSSLSLKHNGKVINDPKDIPNVFAEILEQNYSDNNYNPNFLQTKQTVEKINLEINNNNDASINQKFTMWELTSVIENLKENTSPGPDNIPYAFIKSFPENTIEYLLNIYNHLWTSCTFPSQWKETVIIPIPKPNKDKNNPKNYRPIALSNCLCQVLEKMVNRRLMWYLEDRRLLNPFQSGFRRNRTTTDNLMSLVSEIHTAFQNKQHLVAIFFDLEKAYDMVWKRLILNNLKEYDINGRMLHFITNFLSERRFKVRVNGQFSETKSQNNGIIQGSTISVTLFLVAINKIFTIIQLPVKIGLYADDLLIYCKGKNIKSIENYLQQTLLKLETWETETGFRFSTEKTKAVHFCNLRKHHDNPKLKMHNQDINFTDTTKFLGLTLDRKLKWRPFINQLKSECYMRMNILRVLSHHEWGAHRKILIDLYKSIVRSKLDYGSIIYLSARPSILKLLDTIQTTSLRIAIGAFRTSPVISILAETGEPPLEMRREQLLLNYLTNLANNPENPTFNYLFQTIDNTITIRNTTPFHKKLHSIFQVIKNPIQNIQKIANNSNKPPWILNKPKCDTELAKYKKSDTNQILLQQLFEEKRAAFKNFNFIYTDASKIDNRTGAAIVSDFYQQQIPLPDAISTYSGELIGIREACWWIEQNGNQNAKYVICSDSLSSVLSLKELYSKSSLVQNIQTSISYVKTNKNITIRLMWIPSHVGIKGNEEADVAAKEATLLPAGNEPIPKNDLRAIIKSDTIKKWNTYWNNITSNKLREIEQTPTLSIHRQLTRKQTIALTRLRIGHTRLTHQYLFHRLDPPYCEQCKSVVTVKHVLCECLKFTSERSLCNIPPNISVLNRKNNMENNIIEFLKRTNLLKDI